MTEKSTSAAAADATSHALIAELREIRAEIAEKQKREGEIRETLLSKYSSDKITDEKGEVLIYISRPAPTRRFNGAQFKADHPKLYSDYRVEVESSPRFHFPKEATK